MRRSVLSFLLLLVSLPVLAQLPPPNEPVVVRIESKVLGEQRVILVRTPTSYRTGVRSYPVVYMTDGDRQLAHTAATVDYLAREGRMPEVILVGITNTDRTRDLTPTKTTIDNLAALPTSGGAGKFLSFIETELIPHIEANYRTQPYRVFAGHSFGGLFAMHTLVTKPDLFNGILAVSPSLTWDNHYVNRRVAELLDREKNLNVTLYVTIGNEGEPLDREFASLKALLKKRAPKGLEWEALKFGDEDHGSIVLPTHYAGLRRVFEPWRFALDPKADPRTLHAKAKEHFAKTSKRAGFAILVPEPTTNAIGYWLMAAGHLPDAIAVFRANAETYPQSANVYDSLGEAYEKQGDLDQARASYARAVEIGKKVADPNAPVYEQNLQRVTKATGSVSTAPDVAAIVASLGGTIERDEAGYIKRIDLNNTAVTDADLGFLSAVPTLRELDLRVTKAGDGVIEHIANLDDLEFLNLFKTALTDTGLRRVAGLTELRTLLLGGTKITDAGITALASLTHLRKLSVFRTAVSDAAVGDLVKLPSLEILLIGGSGITEVGAKELQVAKPSLKFSEQT